MTLIRSAFLALALSACAIPVHAIDFVVDDASSDPDDDSPADDAICETAAGNCTLRAAIEEANERTGPHTITFDPSITAITLTADIPDIRAEVSIDGNNGNPTGRVDINANGLFDCFDLIDTGTVTNVPYAINNPNGGQGSTISNLVIRGCSGDGIDASGHGYTFTGNRIGTNPGATAASANVGDGIHLAGTIAPPAIPPNIGSILDDPASNLAEIAAFVASLQTALTVVAEPNLISANLISGNQQSAIELNNPMTTNTWVTANIIGLNVDGTAAIPNGTGGGAPPAVSVNAGAYGNVIGPANVISGNANQGLVLSGAVILPNFVMGNLIGVGSTPLSEVGNNGPGIHLSTTIDDDGTAPDNPTGYTAFIGPANIVSDNKCAGGCTGLTNYGSDADGGLLVDGEGARIFGNAFGAWGFSLAGLDLGSLVSQIGFSTGNDGNGIVLTTGGHQVGGAEPFEANFILHNNHHGILVRGSGTVGNKIQGNFIGVAPIDGLDVFTVGNVGHGIVIFSASGTQIGGTDPEEDNVIAGNGINGIALRQGSSTSGWSNLIQRNQIYANAQTNPALGIAVDLEHDIDVPDVQPDPAGDDPNTNYANFGQNQPTICTGAGTPVAGCTAPSYNAGSGATTASWTLDTRPMTTLRVEYFALTDDGMTFLYDQPMTTDANGLPNGAGCTAGVCTFTGTPGSATDTRGQSIVMTVTDLFDSDVPPTGDQPVPNALTPANNTSEYSLGAAIPQEVAFSSATFSVGEAGPVANITVQRLGDPNGTVTVDVVAVAGGTATGGGVDFTLTGVNPLTWNDGDSTPKSFTVAINDDLLDEADETVNFELQNATGAVEGAPNAATLTITDNDAPPTLSIADNGVNETDATAQLTFTATLSAASSFPVQITWSTGDGSATQPADYTQVSNQMVTIPAGMLSAPLVVDIAGDLIDENPETFTVSATASNITVAGSDLSATGTITDNDPPPQVSINDVGPLPEGNGPATTPFVFTVSIDAVSGLPVTVRVTDGAGGDTATVPSDFANVDQLVTIPAGMLSTQFTVDVVGDTVFEPLPTETFTLNLAADAVQPINATIADGTGIGTITNDDPAPDLAIAKSHVGNFTQGQAGATYSIVVDNVAGSATDGSLVTVTDNLPAGLTATNIAGSGWSCTLATLTCTRSDVLSPGTAYPPITLTVDVAANAPAQVINVAVVGGGGDASAGNNTAMDTTTVDAAATADLSIAKTHAGNFTQGQMGATYTITVSNSAAAPTDGTQVSVVDTLPAGLTATNLAGTGWTCTLATLTCTRTDVLAINASYPDITLTVNVAGNATSPQVNQAVVSGGGDATPLNNTAMDSTVIDGAPPSPDLSIAKSHAGNFTQGQVGATYTITVSNSAAAATDGSQVSVVDTLPAGLTATNLAGTGWTCTLATLTCTRSDVLAVSTAYPDITLTVNVAGNAASPQVNQATVSGGGDTSPLNNTAMDSTTIDAAAVADLSIAKSHVGNFTQGQAGATYSIVVSNSAAAPTSGLVTVVDALPAGLTATNIAGAGWSCTLATLTCTRNDVLAVSSAYPAITVTVNVAGNATSPQVNQATVSGGGDATPGNNTAMDSTTIDAAPVADLSIAKSHVGNFTQGQAGATYSIVVSNSAAAATSGTVTVVDTLPVGLSATGIAGTGWNCTLATLTCTRNDVLAASASYPAITLTVNVAGNATSPQVNQATVSGGGDATPGNNTAMDSTTIDGAPPAPDLSIAKSHVGNFTQGQAGATYSLVVSNSAAAATSGTVTVVDTLPAGLTATNLAGTGWNCTLATLTCTRNDVLAASASYPAITVTVNVAANASSPQVNQATVSGGGDTTPANNTAMDSTTVVAAAVADLSIAKSHVGNFAQGQNGATYSIVVSNSAAAATSGTVTVVDTLPPGLAATAMAGTGWNCTLATTTCTRNDVLAASASYPAITLTVNVTGNATSPQVNQATVSGGGDATAGNNTAMDSTTVTGAPPSPDLSIAKSHVGNFTQGQAGATYSIVVSNSAAAATSGTVTVVDTLPAGLAATAIAGTGWSCTLATLTCTRNDVLAASAAYPAITVTVTVAANAGSPLVNQATVSGGGDATPGNNTAADSTTVMPAAAAGTLQFGAGSTALVINEGGGSIGFTVSRTGGTSGAVSVTVALSGVATAPADFTTSPLTLTWADGDGADKTVTFNVVDDALVEGNEVANLALTAPGGGAVVGASGAATLTIVDNDGIVGGAGAAPITIPATSPWSLFAMVLALLGLAGLARATSRRA